MIIYLLCTSTQRYWSMPDETLEAIIKKDTIYKANMIIHGGYVWSDNGYHSNLWGKRFFKEISQAEAFVRTKGNIDLVEELF